ncbi:uncharacterized protein LOC110107911 isoform X2 [Dendrobium catenatum]|uniref:Nucleolus and neural progenitor protein-like N-terminal domain-containing protein n=1 Tax=Dendrobium catenatum TaxID=906689 RepID=A0A2I0X8Z7_9ASPA|nr:uncharacterized protein LOC110107911 isoform X2 [Dendrobium catenatum]PKU84366.1 hypothetical protein MA16_Dca002879 [Dendrobium catenatum]
MDAKNANLEERLKSLLVQLSSESGIIERIVHKSKNQHRGSLYFQALLKVRRDLRLLKSAGLVQILNALFPIIRGKSPAENAHHSKLNNKSYFVGKHTYHNRLLGVARLLSQMVEPILKAAIQISLLLAKSFFMGFSLTILACLGRLRVLVQQILIDVVSVFNMVSTHSQKHSLKLSSEGIEAFVDYYSSSGDILTLECIWEDDKYVLHESTQCDNNKIPDQGAFPLETQYQTLQLLGEDSCNEQEEKSLNSQPHTNSSLDESTHTGRSIESIDFKMSPVTEPACEPSPGKELLTNLMRTQSKSRKTVAFVSVQVSKTSEMESSEPEKKKMRLDLASVGNADASTAAGSPFPGFSL